MGTAKRERQRQNRQLKQEELARQQKKDVQKKKAIRWGLVAVLILVGIGVVTFASTGSLFGIGADDDEEEVVAPADTTAVDTTVAGGDTTTAGTTVAGAETTVPAETTAPTDTTAAGAATTLPTTVPGGVITGETPCPPAEGAAERILEFEQAPPMCIDESKSYTATFTTNMGEFTVELDPAAAPLAVNNLVVLARYQYFDNTICHRIITDFVVQCGDPSGTGNGDGGRYPGYDFADELPEAGAYQLGSLAMANAGPDTNGSQFFIITGDDGAALPPQYSLFGQVTDGLDTTVPALDALGNPENNGVPPLEEVTIETVTITES